MAFSSLFLCTLFVATPFAASHTQVYTVELEPFGDTSQVTGKAVVFTAHGGTVAYSGSAALMKINGTDSTCAEVYGK
jgi:4-hydroxy-3-methylbut-2-enyl diphosphate reductase IspH